MTIAADDGGEPFVGRSVSSGLYPRNTTAVKAAVLDVLRGDPEALILLGDPPEMAESIGWARQLGLDAVLVSLSPVGDGLHAALGPAAAGLYVTPVVPVPTDDSLPITGAFRRALAAYDTETAPGFVSLEAIWRAVWPSPGSNAAAERRPGTASWTACEASR